MRKRFSGALWTSSDPSWDIPIAPPGIGTATLVPSLQKLTWHPFECQYTCDIVNPQPGSSSYKEDFTLNKGFDLVFLLIVGLALLFVFLLYWDKNTLHTWLHFILLLVPSQACDWCWACHLASLGLIFSSCNLGIIQLPCFVNAHSWEFGTLSQRTVLVA